MVSRRNHGPGGRRGANAIEFAMIAPVLVMMIAGITDYGWYFWREALLINGLRESVRAGGLQQPVSGEATGVCASCTAAATSAANSELGKQGYTTTVAATLQRIPATGLPCTYAVVLDTTIPHERIVTLVPGPTEFDIRVLSMAQNMSCP